MIWGFHFFWEACQAALEMSKFKDSLLSFFKRVEPKVVEEEQLKAHRDGLAWQAEEKTRHQEQLRQESEEAWLQGKFWSCCIPEYPRFHGHPRERCIYVNSSLLWPIVDGKDTVRSQQVFQQAPILTHDSRKGFKVDGTLIATPKGAILPQNALSITYSGKPKKAMHLSKKWCGFHQNERKMALAALALPAEQCGIW